MLSLFLFFVVIPFHVEATHSSMDPSITFHINLQFERSINVGPILTCDHTIKRVAQNLCNYTVYEGEKFTIVTKYSKTINHILCHALTHDTKVFTYIHSFEKEENTFRGEKRMGTLWKCTILAHRGNGVIKPVVRYDDHDYSAAYCFMRIHVRQKEAPQTILVNNVELPAVRTNLSEKGVDFTAEYQYADGDVVKVTCINFRNNERLTMEYNMAGTMSVQSIMKALSSSKMIGFETKLHSGHNNSYMICTRTEEDDYTKVMVKFVMRTHFHNNVFLKINGFTVRLYLENAIGNHFRIDYKYDSTINFPNINVTCEVERTDVKLLVFDEDFVNVSSYSKTETNKKVEMRIGLGLTHSNKQLECATNYPNGTSAEQVLIYFTAGDFLMDIYPLHMKLPSNGTVMELYNDNKLNFIFYEFKDGEILTLTCGSLGRSYHGVQFLQLDGSGVCETNDCSVSKTLRVTSKDENNTIRCYLKERVLSATSRTHVLREIRVILREKVLTTTTPSTLTSYITTAISASSETPTYSSNNDTLLYCLSGVGVAVITIVLVVLYYTIKKKQCCVRSGPPIPEQRIDPATVFYENLLAVFRPINEREAAELEENPYEEIE